MNISQSYSWSSVEKVFWVLEMPFDPIVSLFTQCVADILCLETLKHGTSFKNYLNIRVYGADPSYGGKIGGSSSVSNPKYLDSSKEYFYTFKDSGVIRLEYLPIRMQIDGYKMLINAYKRDLSVDESWMTSYMSIPLRTRLHATMSGSSGEGSLLMGVGHVILSFFTPTVNLRFIPEKLNLSRYKNVKAISSNELDREQNRFQEDVDYGGMAWKTKKAIKTNHIGLQGILKQGFKGNVLQRMSNNPGKCLLGAIRLIALGVLLGAFFSKLTDTK
jgi:hypothetical protein